jgi:hypothetical protein
MTISAAATLRNPAPGSPDDALASVAMSVEESASLISEMTTAR